jgi:hypothetical protein
MVTAECVDLSWSEERWDALVASLADASVFQGSAWARHKAAHGWTARRAVVSEDGKPVAAAQALVKRVPGVAMLWARGGPVGALAHWDGSLRRALVSGLGLSVSYLRVCSYREADAPALSALARLGWRRSGKPLNRPMSMRLDLTRTEAELEAGLSSNWSHNLRRGLKRSAFRRWDAPDAAELAEVYRRMESYKGLRGQHDEQGLASMLKELGSAVRLWRADDEAGKPIALRAAAVFADGAYDLLAAADAAARKVYASYALLWSLALDCRAAGAKSYDLGGADPETAKGIYDFKKGTGARFVDYVGEWDWASPGLARAPLGHVSYSIVNRRRRI